jgi:hypothetical protein
MPLVLGGLALAFLVMLLFGGTELDRGLLILINAGERSDLVQAAELVRVASGDIPLMVATGAAAGWLLLRVSSRTALLLLATTTGGRLLAALLGAGAAVPGPARRQCRGHFSGARIPAHPARAGARARPAVRLHGVDRRGRGASRARHRLADRRDRRLGVRALLDAPAALAGG